MGFRIKTRGRHPVGVARLGDVEPRRLPPLYGLHIGALELGDIGYFAHHGASALRLLADHHLRLHVEGLQPQAEVGLDAEEGLAHNDKRRDVEDEIGGQIVKVQPVVEHEPTDKQVEGKSQSADEVGKKYHPLMGFWSRDDLPCVWEPVRDVCGQVSGFPELRNVLLRNGGDHPLAPRSRHVWNGFVEKKRTWALELERVRMDGQGKEKAWVRKRSPSPFIKAVETVRLPTCLVNPLIPQAP